MPYIRPIGDLRTNSGEIQKIVLEDKQPVFLTRHGIGSMVLLSMEEYDRLVGLQELYLAIDEGIEDIEAGRTVDAKEFMKKLREDISDGRI